MVGASGGVGHAIARSLAEAGSTLALTYRHNQGAADSLARELGATGVAASTHSLDVADNGQVAELFRTVGPLHTVVYAAGPSIPMSFISEIDPEDFRKTVEADLCGFFNLAKASIGALRERGGSIVAITTAGLVRYPKRDALSIAPKGGVEALIRGIAREEGRYDIRANAVAVGVVDAGMFRRLVERGELNQAWLDATKRNTALGRIATGREIGDAVTFLASRRASFITGQTLVVDGGYSL